MEKKQIQNNLSFEDLIKYNNIDDCITHFNTAKQYQSIGDLHLAIKEIELALTGITQIGIDTLLGFYHPNDEDDSILYPTNLKSISARFYFYAAELYAMAGDSEESLKHYKLYHYYNFQTSLPNELKNKESAVLYSFRNYGEYSLGDIINNQITMCHPSIMNDPFDSIANLWTKKEDLERRCTEKKHIEPYRKSFNYYRIRSFVANKLNYETDDSILKNILMWSHYANHHEGFCIKYRLSKHFLKSATISDDKSTVNLLCIKPMNYIQNFVIPDTQKSIDTNLAYFTKSNCWEYENEVRLLCYNTSSEEKILSLPLDDDSQIEEIIFGYRCNKQNIETIKSLINEFSALKSVKLHKMTQDIREGVYNLTKEKI